MIIIDLKTFERVKKTMMKLMGNTKVQLHHLLYRHCRELQKQTKAVKDVFPDSEVHNQAP